MFRLRSVFVGVLLVAAVALSGCGAKQQPAAPESKVAEQPKAAPEAKPATATPKGTRYAVVADQSKASYTANEKFANRQLPNDAVGTTSAVQGELILDGGALQPSKVTVDLRTLKSDEPRRDSRLLTQGLESQKYPFAEFTVKGAEGGVTIPSDGKEVSFKLAARQASSSIWGTSIYSPPASPGC